MMQSTTTTTSSTGSRRVNLQQLYGRGMSIWKKIQADPRVAGVMNTRVYLYLSTHPFAALSVLIFSALALVPFGVFFSLVLIVTTISALGFVFFEGFLLFFGGLALLFVLSGIAFFSVFVTLVFGSFYVTGSSISSRLSLGRKKADAVKGEDGEGKSSAGNNMTKECSIGNNAADESPADINVIKDIPVENDSEPSEEMTTDSPVVKDIKGQDPGMDQDPEICYKDGVIKNKASFQMKETFVSSDVLSFLRA